MRRRGMRPLGAQSPLPQPRLSRTDSRRPYCLLLKKNRVELLP